MSPPTTENPPPTDTMNAPCTIPSKPEEMTVTSKSQALRIAKAHAAAGGRYEIHRFCTGKYKELPCEWVGKLVVKCDGVLAVWGERRRDSEGPYTTLRCVVAR